ncbi:MAG: hypothetical protein K2J33_07625, partial [Alistipes sp.]|nr:hypothetical protein [Alistipes sp.]
MAEGCRMFSIGATNDLFRPFAASERTKRTPCKRASHGGLRRFTPLRSADGQTDVFSARRHSTPSSATNRTLDDNLKRLLLLKIKKRPERPYFKFLKKTNKTHSS